MHLNKALSLMRYLDWTCIPFWIVIFIFSQNIPFLSLRNSKSVCCWQYSVCKSFDIVMLPKIGSKFLNISQSIRNAKSIFTFFLRAMSKEKINFTSYPSHLLLRLLSLMYFIHNKVTVCLWGIIVLPLSSFVHKLFFLLLL